MTRCGAMSVSCSQATRVSFALAQEQARLPSGSTNSMDNPKQPHACKGLCPAQWHLSASLPTAIFERAPRISQAPVPKSSQTRQARLCSWQAAPTGKRVANIRYHGINVCQKLSWPGHSSARESCFSSRLGNSCGQPDVIRLVRFAWRRRKYTLDF